MSEQLYLVVEPFDADAPRRQAVIGIYNNKKTAMRNKQRIERAAKPEFPVLQLMPLRLNYTHDLGAPVKGESHAD